MKIRILVGEQAVAVTLDDTPTARDFAALLPLSLTLEDYGTTEKISMLPRKLDIAGARAGTTPLAGDLCYYAPWGNLAIFLKPFRHSPGLMRLGGWPVIRPSRSRAAGRRGHGPASGPLRHRGDRRP